MVRVTVQSIADELGLSKYAVSRALSGKSGVSEQTRQTVIEKAEDLGYTARKRMSRRLGAIEIIYHDHGVAHRELWMEVQAGAQTEARRLGIATAVRWTDDPKIAGRVTSPDTGFLLVGPHDDAMFNATMATGQPSICVGNHPWRDLSSMDFVYSTDKEATRKVGEYLLDLGHRRIVYAHGRPGYPGRIERFNTFSDALAGRAELDEMTFSDDNAPDDFQNDLLSMVKRGFEPTAFFCGNDGVAVTVISQLMRIGLQIPRDISVVGFADYAIATQIAPALTTVRVPYRAMGAASVRMLMSRLGKNEFLTELPPLRMGLVSELIERDSTGPASEYSLLSKLRI